MEPIADELIASLARRVERAQAIAEELRHDDKLHRLAMTTVFVLEDALFAMHEQREIMRHANGEGTERNLL